MTLNSGACGLVAFVSSLLEASLLVRGLTILNPQCCEETPARLGESKPLCEGGAGHVYVSEAFLDLVARPSNN